MPKKETSKQLHTILFGICLEKVPKKSYIIHSQLF